MGQPYLKYHSDDSLPTVEKVDLRVDEEYSIADSSLTSITWKTENYNDYEMHHLTFAPQRITFKRPGTYMVGLGIKWFNNATGYRSCEIVENDSSTIAISKKDANAGSNFNDCFVLYKADADQYVTAKVFHTRGSNLSIKIASATFFWAFRVN